jgi:hypothetical protein
MAVRKVTVKLPEELYKLVEGHARSSIVRHGDRPDRLGSSREQLDLLWAHSSIGSAGACGRCGQHSENPDAVGGQPVEVAVRESTQTLPQGGRRILD